MQPYIPKNHLPLAGIILLLVASILSGLVIGALAYFISQFIYFIVVFPLVIGAMGMIVYYRLILFAGVRQTLLLTLFGLSMGLCIAFAFYEAPYFILRNDFITNVQKEYQVDFQDASAGFDKVLIGETGSSGLLGYMKLRAREGDTYTNYFIINSMPLKGFSFTLKSTWAWIYWSIEVILFSISGALMGFQWGKKEYNFSANDWYDHMVPKQFGAASIENKAKLFAGLNGNNLDEINQLLVSEDELSHPMLELYRQHSRNKKGDILVRIKQTTRINPTKVKRITLNQWEVPPHEFEQIRQVTV